MRKKLQSLIAAKAARKKEKEEEKNKELQRLKDVREKAKEEEKKKACKIVCDLIDIRYKMLENPLTEKETREYWKKIYKNLQVNFLINV